MTFPDWWGERGSELLVNQGEGMLFGDGDIVFKVSVDKNVAVGLVIRLGVTNEVPM